VKKLPIRQLHCARDVTRRDAETSSYQWTF